MIIVLTADAANQTGVWTFCILWLARLSTKLNIYLGVPNHTEQFLPKHLKYIATYFCRRPMNLLFPLTVTATTLVTAMLIDQALQPDALPFEIAGFVFLATLMALAVLEHWFLVLPIPSAELWTWGLASRDAAERQIASERTPQHANEGEPPVILQGSRQPNRTISASCVAVPRANA